MSVPGVNLWPFCEFDDCGSGNPPAVAVVPLVSPGMAEPYAWVLSCSGCLRAASGAVRPGSAIKLNRK